MAKYLFLGRFTKDGANGLLKEKASGREAVASAAFESVGGKLEALYYTAGKYSFVIIADVPEGVSLVTVSTAARAAGTVGEGEFYPLFGVAEVDAALAKGITYRASGNG